MHAAPPFPPQKEAMLTPSHRTQLPSIPMPPPDQPPPTMKYPDLQKTNKFLEDKVARLSAELIRYQGLMKTGVDPSISAGAQPPIIPPWETDGSQSPLFVAYDQRIAELEQQLNQSKEESDRFKERCDQLFSDNKRLYGDLKGALATLENQRKTALQAVGSACTQEEYEELHQRVELVTAENDILCEQVRVLQTELGATRGRLAEQEKIAQRCTGQAAKADRAASHAEHQVAALEGRLKKAHKRLAQRDEASLIPPIHLTPPHGGQLRTLTAERAALGAAFEDAKRQVEQDVGAVDAQRRAAEERLARTQAELGRTRDALHAQDIRVDEANSSLRKCAAERDELRARLTQAEADLEQLQQEHGALVGSLATIEKRIAEADEREVRSADLCRQSAEMVQEATAHKEQAAVRARQADEHAARLDALLQQKTAEEQQQRAVLVQSLEAQCQRKVAAAKARAEKAEQDLAQAAAKLEQAEADRQALMDRIREAEGGRRRAPVDEVVDRLNEELATAKSELALARTEADRARKEAAAQAEGAKGLAGRLERRAGEADQRLAATEQLLREEKRVRQGLQAELQQQQRRAEDALGQLTQWQQEQAKQAADLRAAYEEQLRTLREQLGVALEAQDREVTDVNELFASQEALLEQMKSQSKSAMERVVWRLRDENKRLASEAERRRVQVGQALRERDSMRQIAEQERGRAETALQQVASLVAERHNRAMDAVPTPASS
ncbi:hypothetical protein PAPYR_306 [Paratrimastix pyriformis]|uniref:Uncharacterized protein n=1 Tax=Paratrimastix pyriformis TaxID=342808 RepID=A0ABQ8UX58_9EUKA|nr:hypothetical protein PAPYR_306 [Paratrimastix pyriformis]